MEKGRWLLALVSRGLLKQGIHRFAREEGLAFLGIVALADVPDGEQTGHFVRRQILLEDAQGFLGQLLFGFDDGTHGVCWKQATTKSAGFKRVMGPW